MLADPPRKPLALKPSKTFYNPCKLVTSESSGGSGARSKASARVLDRPAPWLDLELPSPQRPPSGG